MKRRILSTMILLSAVLLAPRLLADVATLPQEAPRPSGIYVALAGSSEAAPVRLEPTLVMQASADGVWKSAFTGGFSKPTIVMTVPGAKSGNRLTDPRATFEFVFPTGSGKPNGSDMSQMALMMEEATNGLPRGTSDPKQYLLAQLDIANDDRVLRVGKSPVAVVNVESIAPKVFRVRPRQALAPGEYGIYQKDSPGRVWDFGVDP